VLFRALIVQVGVIICLIPDKYISKLILCIWPCLKGPEPDISRGSHQYGWDLVVEEIHGQLVFINKV
jgi:hypothetical protein